MNDRVEPQLSADKKGNAEVKKLELEAQKIELEIKHLRRWPILHPSAYIPVVTSLLALSGVLAGLVVTTQQKDQAVVEKKEAISEKQEQASYATSLERQIQQSPIAPPKTVVIRFRGALSREKITALQLGFNSAGFVALPPQRTTDVIQSSVTYYDANDKALAEQVLNHTSSFFNQQGCPIHLQLISLAGQANNNKPSTVLLDIYHSC